MYRQWLEIVISIHEKLSLQQSLLVKVTTTGGSAGTVALAKGVVVITGGGTTGVVSEGVAVLTLTGTYAVPVRMGLVVELGYGYGATIVGGVELVPDDELELEALCVEVLFAEELCAEEVLCAEVLYVEVLCVEVLCTAVVVGLETGAFGTIVWTGTAVVVFQLHAELHGAVTELHGAVTVVAFTTVVTSTLSKFSHNR